VGVVVALACIWSGLAITGCITSSVFPLSLSRFTSDASLIGLVLAISPFASLIAGPLVGTLGDGSWRARQGRLLIVIVAAPLLGLCLFAMPEAALLWHLVIYFTAYQLLHDGLWAAAHPLVFVLNAPKWRTLITAILMMSAQAVGWLFARYGMRLLDGENGEEWIYRLSAVAQLVLILLPMLYLRSDGGGRSPVARAGPPAGAGRPWSRTMVRWIAVISFCECSCRQILHGFFVLFATRSLDLAPAAFGGVWAYSALATFVCALPVGLLADRWLPKPRLLLVGYLILCLACLAGWWAQSATGLALSVMLFGAGRAITTITQRPFLNDFVPLQDSGRVNGLFSGFLSLGRILAMVGAGAVIHWLQDDYRAIFPLCFGLMGVSIIMLLLLPNQPPARVSAVTLC